MVRSHSLGDRSTRRNGEGHTKIKANTFAGSEQPNFGVKSNVLTIKLSWLDQNTYYILNEFTFRVSWAKTE